jgi:hypothetical protein
VNTIIPTLQHQPILLFVKLFGDTNLIFDAFVIEMLVWKGMFIEISGANLLFILTMQFCFVSETF